MSGKKITVLTVLIVLIAGLGYFYSQNTSNLQGSFSASKSTVKSDTTKVATSSSYSDLYVAKIDRVTPDTSVTVRTSSRVTIGKWKVTPYHDGKLTKFDLSWPDTSTSEISYGTSGTSGNYFDNVQLDITSGGTTTSYDIVKGSSAAYPDLTFGETYTITVTGLLKTGKSVYGGLSLSAIGFTLDSNFKGKNSYVWNSTDSYGVNSYFQATATTGGGSIFGGVTYSVK